MDLILWSTQEGLWSIHGDMLGVRFELVDADYADNGRLVYTLLEKRYERSLT